MGSQTKNKVSVKVFIGFQVTIDLKFHLNRSNLWKEAAIVSKEDSKLELVRFEDSEYLGRYLKHSMISMKEIVDQSKDIKECLKRYVPEFDIDVLKIQLFPHVFVA